MSLRLLARLLRKRFSPYEPLVNVRLSKKNLLHNLHTYQTAYPALRIAPVLKSNAYGHGLAEIASLLDTEHVAFFVLDSLHEALQLQKIGIRSPLLIIGYTSVHNMRAVRRKNIAFTITSLSQLEELAEADFSVRIHIKLDTGMHRQGLREEEWLPAQQLLTTHTHITLEGVCSHFADADNEDTTFTHVQCVVWERAVSFWKAAFPSLTFLHIGATSGASVSASVPGNVIRVGLGLYGIDAASQKKLLLQPVLQLETILSSLKKLLPGECVGYNATFTAHEPLRIATIPVGYFEGIDRRLSNKGSVLVAGIPCPIIGRVSMNIATIDVSKVPHAVRGDTVVVISNTSTHTNSVEGIARTCETIPWEILVHIPQHLRRTVM